MKLKNFIIFLQFFLCLLSPVSAEVFKIKYLEAGVDKLVARDKTTGKVLWRSTLETFIKESNQGKIFFAKEIGSGIYGKEKKKLNWVFESQYLIKEDKLLPSKAVLEFFEENSRPYKKLEKIYDWDNMKIYCLTSQKKQEFTLKPDLFGSELIGFFLANYPFEEKRDFIFYLLTHEPTVYKMTLKYIGPENLEISGHTIPCYKLEMIPDLGALGIFGAFVPKTYFWFKQNPPHKFVRYEGLESGLGTPYIIEEIEINN